MEVQYYISLLIVQTGIWQFDRKIMTTEIKGENDHKLILMAMSGIFLFIMVLSIWHHRIEKVKKRKCSKVNKSFQKVKIQCWQWTEWGLDEQHTQYINTHQWSVAVTRSETRQRPGLSANTENHPIPLFVLTQVSTTSLPMLTQHHFNLPIT